MGNTVAKGDFRWMHTEDAKIMADAMAAANSINGAWEWLAKPVPRMGYGYCSHEMCTLIRDTMRRNYSTEDYAWSINMLHDIATDGWAEWVNKQKKMLEKLPEPEEKEESPKDRIIAMASTYIASKRSVPRRPTPVTR